MFAAFICYLIFYVIAFFLYGVEQLFKNNKYTLRDVFMGLLIACSGPLYLIICFASFVGTYIVTLIFLIEEFVKDPDMHNETVLFTDEKIQRIISKVRKIVKR